jgi:hypothetical protein
MQEITYRIPDKKGNQLLVALLAYDNQEKINELQIPEEFADVDIIEVSITKEYVDQPIEPVVFLRLTTLLLREFNKRHNAVFFYQVSFEENLQQHHSNLRDVDYRASLFDLLQQRVQNSVEAADILVCDSEVGVEEYSNPIRIYFRERHRSIVQCVAENVARKYG